MTTVLPSDLSFLAPVETNDLIRVGAPGDGGYVVSRRAVMSADILLSFGISSNWTFEEHFRALNSRALIHAYDHTISEMAFRRQLQKNLIRFTLGRAPWISVSTSRATLKRYRGSLLSLATHFQEEIHERHDGHYHANIDKVFGRVPMGNVFLKIDIEGSEYGIVDDLVRYAPRITGVVFEFHQTSALRETFYARIRKLQEAFHIVHLHPNNHGYLGADGLPNTLEVTFNAGVAPEGAPRTRRLPLPYLDAPNKVNAPEIELHFQA